MVQIYLNGRMKAAKEHVEYGNVFESGKCGFLINTKGSICG